MYCLTVPEAGRLEARCRPGHAPSEASAGGAFLATTSVLWPLDFCVSVTPISVTFSLWLHIVFPLNTSVSVFKFPLFIRTPVIWIRAHPNDLIFTCVSL